MKIEVTVPNGLPKVAWVQRSTQTGETIGGRRDKWAALIGLGVGLLIAAGSNDIRVMLAAPPICAAAAWMLRTADHKVQRPRKEQRPILVEQYCEARIERRIDQLLFCWSTEGKRVKRHYELPLEQVSEMVTGGTNEWFGDAGEQNLHEEHVILMPGVDGQMLTIAMHGGGRAEIARLHAVLTRNIVEPRHMLLRLLAKELAERRFPSGGSDVPHSV